MVRIKKMKFINIYSDSSGNYVVHNTRKDFSNGHTHINNFNTAKYIAYLVIYKKLPKRNHLSIYLIDSVIRLSDDRKYIAQINLLKDDIIKKKNRHLK